MITLFHWDLPDELDKRYGGLLNKAEFVADYAHYARVVFEAIPKCKYWITFNEPWCSSILGYNTGDFAPGHTSDRKRNDVGDSSRECWTVGHNCLLAHGTAVKIYREEFKPQNGGEIGITLNGKSPPVVRTSVAESFQVTVFTRGTRLTQQTSRLRNGSWSSPSRGLLTPSTLANTPIPCASNLETVFPRSHPKRSP